MPFICIGPVCIPWNVAIPILVVILKPIWSLLPKSVQDKIEFYCNRFIVWLRATVPYLDNSKLKPNNPNDNGLHIQREIDSLLQNTRQVSARTSTEKKDVVSLMHSINFDCEKAVFEKLLCDICNGNGPEADALDKIATEYGVCVKFGATWCRPCKQIQPEVEKLAQLYCSQCVFLDVDIDVSPTIASLYGVGVVPSFHLLGKDNSNIGDGVVSLGSLTGARVEALGDMLSKLNH